MVWEKKKNRGTLNTKKSLNMNNQKALGKIRGALNAKKSINTYDQKVMGKKEK